MGLKDAGLSTLEKILRDLGDEIVLENILPRDWNQRDEVLKNTRFVRVFISHLDEQRELAQSLSEFLSRHNMRCFVAHADIKPSADWSSEIKKALRTMECFVAFNIKVQNQVRHYKDSAWCMQEAGAAVVRDVPIITLCDDLSKDDLKDRLGFLKEKQILSLSKEKEENKKRILEAIQHDPSIKDRLLKIDNLAEQERQKSIQKQNKDVDDEIPF